MFAVSSEQPPTGDVFSTPIHLAQEFCGGPSWGVSLGVAPSVRDMSKGNISPSKRQDDAVSIVREVKL